MASRRGMMRTATTLAIYVELARGSSESMAAQLARQLRQAVLDGRLPPDTRLPSSRTLAELLKVSRPVVQEAYRILEAGDLVESRRRSGTYVRRARPDKAAGEPGGGQPSADRVRRTLVDLSPDQPSGEDFPVPVWRAAWRRAAHRIPGAVEIPGETVLRRAVAAHLRAVRGLEADPENVLITTGVRQSLDLVAAVAIQPGAVAAVEDPCLPTVIRLLRQHDVTTVPVPVDADGALVEAVPRTVGAVVVRPSHQMPLGVELSLSRRRALVELSAARGALIVEDDRDHDFSETIRPQSLWDLSRDRTDDVVYVGCLCRLLPDVVCTGYILARGRRLRQLAEHLSLRQSGTVAVAQRAVAEMLASAETRVRVDRLRHAYQAKRQLVVDALARHPAVERLSGAQSGSHVHVELRPEVHVDHVIRAFETKGIVAPATARYEWSGLVPARNGFLVSHNHLTEAVLSRALGKMIRCLDHLVPCPC
ncbi:PLP-dependent aminotransferase family protein [Microbispora catharanthi]|uniref:GntR family transcriptional regulator n=1 Tax=Microbispora catharanthi TaxID=1712871 RepID=A0A5N6BYF7_9ACTN|nr:PLP-dependent aminotransferase family protein [Microbispora catharanthi]KAB8185498.1 GntR family transcriptional regulator [Microbispora catharanthi]